MSLTAGTRLGPYEITALLGAGGTLMVVQNWFDELRRLVPVR